MEFTTDIQEELVEAIKEDYGKNPTLDDTDDFAGEYFGDYGSAIKFLNGLGASDMLEAMDEMAQKYEDPAVLLDWIADPQELANELVGYIVRTGLGLWD